MPKLRLRVPVLWSALENDLVLARPLLFPEATCLASGLERLPPLLARRVRQIARGGETADLHRRAFAGRLTTSVTSVTVPALRDRVERSEPVRLNFTVARWTVAPDSALAYVPALDIEVLAADPVQLDELLPVQILAELGRRKAAESVETLARLERQARAEVRVLRVVVPLPTPKQAAVRERDRSAARTSVFKEVATDAGRPGAPRIYRRDALLTRLAELLTGPDPRSVLLVGPSGVGKSALFAELAGPRRPAALADRPCWMTSGAQLVAGQTGFGMWQQRCQRLVREARESRALIHLGNLLELVETGKSSCSTIGVAAMLRSAIADGDLLAVAECTPDELAYVERENPQYLEAFAVLDVPPLSSADTLAVLRDTSEERAARAQRRIAPAALEELERLHRRYATYSASPGRAVRFLRNLLDDATATVGGPAVAPEAPPLDPTDVVAAFSRETGLPLRMLDDRQTLDLDDVRRWFAGRVIGQSRPVELVVDLLASIKSQLARSGKPLASFLFIGPTGVGKTEMAKSLAEFLYQDPTRMIRFDMSEYATAAAAQRLAGGLDGSPGRLVQEVRDQPFMVVLLDEFEKAHPLVFDLLLQVLGEGRLADARGRVADFTNSVIVMTSNLGVESYRPRGTGFADGGGRERDAAEHFEREVREFLRPELFNRLDRIVPFAPLERDVIQAIARREIEALERREGLRMRDLRLEVTPAAAEWLAATGYDPRYGARPLKRVVERRLIAPLAERLAAYATDASLRARVDATDDRLVFDVSAVSQRTRGVEQAGATGVVRQIQELRREMQRLLRSGALLRLRNEIERLKQVERERRGRAKRRRKASVDAERNAFQFTPAQAKLLAHERLLGAVDSSADDARRLEDAALEAFYDGRTSEFGELDETRRALDGAFRRALFELHVALHPSKGLLTLAVFGDARERILELAAAYERIARREQALATRFWLAMHDPRRLDQEARPAGSGGPPGPVLRLLSRKNSDDDVPRRTLDVYADDRGAPPPYVGVALQIRGERAALLLESESGAHEFVAAGKTERCWVEATSDRVVSYSPPADAGRAGAFRDAPLRRTYDFDEGECRDPSDAPRTFPLDRRGIDEALAAAVNEGFQRRLGRTFE